MAQDRTVHGKLTLFLALVGAVVGAAPGAALAQDQGSPGPVRIAVTRTMNSEQPGGLISKRALEGYERMLDLQNEQKQAAETIYEGYAAAYKEAVKQNRAAIEEMSRTAQETDDNSVFMEKMPALEKQFSETVKRLEKGFFGDLKAVLNPDQEGSWARVERARRREVGLKNWTVNGESVDLTEVVEGLKLDAKTMAGLREPLEQYEVELDRQLAERDKVNASAEAWEPGKPLFIDALKDQMARQHEAGKKVREVNERNARKLEGLLPEGVRAEFNEQVKRRSFPQVYRESRTAKSLAASLKLTDLSADQRTQIEGLKQRYERDLASANDAWVNAIRESDASGEGGTVGMGSGTRMRINFGAEEKGPLADARKARRELDEKTRERLNGVLTEAQRASVSKEVTPDPEEGPMGGGVVIRRGG